MYNALLNSKFKRKPIVNKKSPRTIDLKSFIITIPDKFKILNPNKNFNEILSLIYKNELKIYIHDDYGNNKELHKSLMSLNKNMDMLEYTFKIKFTKWKNQFRGFDVSKIKKEKLNGLDIVSASFVSKINGNDYYYDIKSINIGNYFYDIIVTGLQSKKEYHLPLVNDLLQSIKIQNM